MQPELLGALRARQMDIRARWTELLQVEPVNTPLAHPEALAHLIEWTMADIFRDLTNGRRLRLAEHDTGTSNRALCACGRNPLLAYFDAASQAWHEALVLAQSTDPLLDPVERDASLEELNRVLHVVARHEIEAFCGVCQHRAKPEYSSCHAAVGPPSA